MRARFLAVCLGAVFSLAPFASQAQDTAPSRTDYYELGQQFAYCSAYFKYGADLAAANGLADSAVALQGMERGWRVAGLLFLVEGLHSSRQSEAEEIFANLQEIRIDKIRADREMARVNGDTSYDARLGDRFTEECGQWIELQQAVIQEMRSGPANSE